MFDMLGKIFTRRFIKRPLFVVGGSRSGTIVLLKALGKHKQILAAPTEDPFITDLGGLVHDLEFCSEREQKYYSRTLRISRDYIYRVLHKLAIESSMGPNYGFRHLVNDSLSEKRLNIFRKRYWCTKTFPTPEVGQGLLKLYPQARFVWILRNGVSVVHSRTKFPEFRGLPFEEHCRHWSEKIMEFDYLNDIPEAIVIHQEDLLDNPAVVFRSVFDHIGIDDDGLSTNYAMTHHVHPLDDCATSTGVDIKKTIAERPPAYQEWSDMQRQQFKDICGHAMQQAGYEIEF